MIKLTGEQVAEAGLTGWVFLLGGLQTRVHTGDYAAGLALVAAIGAAAADRGREPDVDLRPGHVDVRLRTPEARGVTEADVGLARAITAAAAEAGLATSRDTVSRLEMALDTPDRRAVLPFWSAVLAVDGPPRSGGADDELIDPYGALPVVWFQQSGGEEPRQRWHPDVWVDPAQVQPRLEAALAAGGTLVSDAEAPSFWVLADPEGNRVCLCTWQDRRV